MIYLAIMLALGLAGIFKLWTAQRRASARLYSLDAHQSLKRLSDRPAVGTVSAARFQRREPRRPGARPRRLTPDQRAAAKRRIAARRRAMRARAS